jgi:copper(I)-binding protein
MRVPSPEFKLLVAGLLWGIPPGKMFSMTSLRLLSLCALLVMPGGVAVLASDVGDAKLDEQVLVIRNAWIREAPPVAKVNGGYLTLENTGAEALSLMSIQSEAFEKIEVHEMTTVDGMMRMREIPQLLIPAGGQVTMQPGGKHLMLIGPRRRLSAGEVATLTLTFDSGQVLVVSVVVRNEPI